MIITKERDFFESMLGRMLLTSITEEESKALHVLSVILCLLLIT